MGGGESKFRKYDPQPSLRGGLDLSPDERILATFRFQPANWESVFYGSRHHPVPLGSVDGLGHLTNKRIALFWSTKAALSAKTVHYGGEGAAKVAEAVDEKVLGHFLGAVSSIASRTRHYMEARAKEHASTHGIASWYFSAHDASYSTSREWLARTSDGTFFLVRGGGRGPDPAMTFLPAYMEQEWSVDDAAEFDKLLTRVGVTPKKVKQIRRGSDGLVVEYISW
ncbi:hypothetical protein RJ55_03664 [Drechmeria coniospora]|nr:hypothetical protein RJ55_03664 [Drechmeria coniospora]